ncbi:MAG: InlB B-repeat-containing protein [Clostridia bacterium]|nr:InlB B-repeat-containing protein [Clostridia bacterium]
MQITKRVLSLLFGVVAPCALILTGCDKPMPEVVTEHTITYAGVDGATNPNTITKYNKNDAEIELLEPTKDNYTFVNWTYNGTAVTKIDPK